jgi:hypothetical protein
MPFKSEKQRRWMHANEPEMAKDWEKKKKTESPGKVKKFKQMLLRKGIKIRYDRAVAEKDLQQKYGGRGHVVAKKFGIRRAFYAAPSTGATPPSPQSKPKIAISKPEMDTLHRDKKLDKGNVQIVFTEGKKVTVKEISKWLKGLEEFRYRKVRGVDARRVASFINNGINEKELPKSLQKKWEHAKYGREKHLANKFMSKLSEEKKRDYKAEYKKFQSSTKMKKYRAELNKYNRKKGTYGNGDGKDASHKGGKIVGFESQSKNRGRAEKSRLKKESSEEYGKSLDKIANDKKLKAISNKDRETLKKLAKLLNKEGFADKLTKKMKKHKGTKVKKTKPIKLRGLSGRGKISHFGMEEATYQLPKRYTSTDVDEIDAALYRAGINGIPDFTKKTWTTMHDKVNHSKLKKIMKRIGAKKIKESVDERTVKQQKKYKIGTKMKPVKMGKTQRVTKDKKYRILTIRQWLKFPNYAQLVIKGVHHIDTRVDGKLKQLPVVFVDDRDKVVKFEHVEEGFGGELKGADKKKFEKARTKNGEQLGYTLTGTSDINEAGMEINKLKDAILMFQKKIKKQGMVTNARDEEHLKNLIRVYKQMGGKGVKEGVNEAIEPAGIMAKINKIVQDKQAAKIDGVLMDMFSANIMMRIFNAVNDKNKKEMNKGTMRQVKVILHKVMKHNKVKG